MEQHPKTAKSKRACATKLLKARAKPKSLDEMETLEPANVIRQQRFG
jgi:hypothetical protein